MSKINDFSLLTAFEKVKQLIDLSNSPNPITHTVARLTEFQIRI